MYDVIIIGSGLGGLLCGSKLARSGKKVLVLEKHFNTGGFASIFRRKKWKFDVSLHCLSGLNKGGRVNEIFNDIGLNERVEFLKADDLYSVAYPDKYLCVNGDVEEYTSMLQEQFPKEEKGISDLFQLFIDIRNEMINPGKGAPLFWKYLNYNLQEMIDEFICSRKIQSIICQLWGYFGLPPKDLSAVYFSYAWTDYHVYGGFYPKNRSQTITDELKAIIEENGGEVKKRQEVTEILLEDNKAKGVKTKKEKVFYGKYIISNIDPKQTLEKIEDKSVIPERYIQKVKNIQPSFSCVQAYIIMDGDFSELYGENSHEVFINNDYDLSNLHEQITQGMYKEMPYCLTIYENINPHYHKQGENTLTMMQICDREEWMNLEREVYKDKKKKLTEMYIDRLNKDYPGIKDRIKYIELATPKTVKRYTGHYNSAIYGAAQTVEQSMHRSLPQKTPVENLYLVGAWTRPGAGYSGVISSGYTLAKNILKKESRISV